MPMCVCLHRIFLRPEKIPNPDVIPLVYLTLVVPIGLQFSGFPIRAHQASRLPLPLRLGYACL